MERWMDRPGALIGRAMGISALVGVIALLIAIRPWDAAEGGETTAFAWFVALFWLVPAGAVFGVVFAMILGLAAFLFVVLPIALIRAVLERARGDSFRRVEQAREAGADERLPQEMGAHPPSSE
jgi:hypothetical protein